MLTDKGAICIQAVTVFSILGWLAGDPTLITASITLIMLLLVDVAEFGFARRSTNEMRTARTVERTKLQVGDELNVTLQITRVRNFGAHLHLEDEIPLELDLSSGSNVCDVSSGSRIVELLYRVEARQMGDCKLENIHVTIHDGLGLMTDVITLNEQIPLEIYPKVKLMPAMLATRSAIATQSIRFGQRPNLAIGHGGDFHSVRNYHPGDELKHVVWKAVARTPKHKLMTREFETEQDQHYIIAFHAKETMLNGPIGHRTIDYVVESIISLTYAACKESVWLSTTFGSNSIQLAAPGRGRDRQIADAMSSLYNIKPSNGYSLEKVVKEVYFNKKRHSNVIAIIDCEYEDCNELMALRHLAEKNCVMIIVIRTTSLFQKPHISEAMTGFKILLDNENARIAKIIGACAMMGLNCQVCNATDLLNVLQDACAFRGI